MYVVKIDWGLSATLSLLLLRTFFRETQSSAISLPVAMDRKEYAGIHI